MYGEQFAVPEPLETVFISWFQGGEVFRSGLTWRRGAGNIFYFRPGHETYPTYHDATVQKVLRNAVKWAHNPQGSNPAILDAPNVPVEKALEPIVERGCRKLATCTCRRSQAYPLNADRERCVCSILRFGKGRTRRLSPSHRR